MSHSQDGVTRRSFLHSCASAAASCGAMTAASSAFEPQAAQTRSGDRDPWSDADWADVLGAFDLGGHTPMNTANLGPACRAAREALRVYTDSVDADPSFQNRAQFGATRTATREAIAGYLRIEPSEVAVTRNTTEGNNFVVQGLDLGPDDEVVLSAHNHPSNLAAWQRRAQRRGFLVQQVDVGSPPESPERLFADLRAACSSRTRVLSFSHVTNLGGCRFPAAEICSWAREHGILTLVDGAQSAGALDLDLHVIGCDFFTASAHKWFCGPREAGLLYVRAAAGERLWPTIVGLGHDRAEGAARFETLGQRDDAAVAAFGLSVEFFHRIGSAAIEARVASLAARLKEQLTEIPGVRLYTPTPDAFSGGVVAFRVAGVEPRAAFRSLYEEHRIAGAPSGVEGGGLRLSPHIYNSLADCDRAIVAVREIARSSA